MEEQATGGHQPVAQGVLVGAPAGWPASIPAGPEAEQGRTRLAAEQVRLVGMLAHRIREGLELPTSPMVAGAAAAAADGTAAVVAAPLPISVEEEVAVAQAWSPARIPR